MDHQPIPDQAFTTYKVDYAGNYYALYQLVEDGQWKYIDYYFTLDQAAAAIGKLPPSSFIRWLV